MLENEEKITYIFNKFKEKDEFFCELFKPNLLLLNEEKKQEELNWFYGHFEENEEDLIHCKKLNFLYFAKSDIAWVVYYNDKQQIEVFDIDWSMSILCDSFFEIPFELFMYRYGKPSIFELFKVENEKYLINIKKYIKWLNDNNLMNNINPKYIETINKYKIEDGKTPFYYKYGQEIIEKLKNRDKVFCNVFGFINDDKKQVEKHILENDMYDFYSDIKENIIYSYMAKSKKNNNLIAIVILNNYKYRCFTKDFSSEDEIFHWPFWLIYISFNNKQPSYSYNYIKILIEQINKNKQDFKIYSQWLNDNNIYLEERFSNILKKL